jgi:NDP-sugar pyrophosphorylase family protein
VHDAGLLHGSFLVLYGDSFLPFDFREFGVAFARQTRPAMMAVFRNHGRFDTGNVRYADGMVGLYRKGQQGEAPAAMDYIDYGVSALRRSVIADNVRTGAKADLADIYHRLSLDHQLAGWEVAERFYEVGSPAGLRDFEGWVAQHPVESWANHSSCSTGTAC